MPTSVSQLKTMMKFQFVLMTHWCRWQCSKSICIIHRDTVKPEHYQSRMSFWVVWFQVTKLKLTVGPNHYTYDQPMSALPYDGKDLSSLVWIQTQGCKHGQNILPMCLQVQYQKRPLEAVCVSMSLDKTLSSKLLLVPECIYVNRMLWGSRAVSLVMRSAPWMASLYESMHDWGTLACFVKHFEWNSEKKGISIYKNRSQF